MRKKNNVTAVILAGGRATRMHGQDKGLLRLAGKTFVEQLAEQLAKQTDKIIINANRNLEQYRQTALQIVTDNLSDFQGPLAGMLAALQVIDTEWLITAPCDGPFVAADYVDKMLTAANQANVKLAVASDGEWLQPVYALIHSDLETSLIEFLQSGERKIDHWYRQHQFAEVVFDREAADSMFTNVNTPEQLELVKQIQP